MNLAETRYLSNLVKGVRAIMLVSDFEPKVRKIVTDKAMAVKLFAEAGCRREAVAVVQDLRLMFAEHEHKDMVDRLVDDVIKHWMFQNLVPKGDA